MVAGPPPPITQHSPRTVFWQEKPSAPSPGVLFGPARLRTFLRLIAAPQPGAPRSRFSSSLSDLIQVLSTEANALKSALRARATSNFVASCSHFGALADCCSPTLRPHRSTHAASTVTMSHARGAGDQTNSSDPVATLTTYVRVCLTYSDEY